MIAALVQRWILRVWGTGLAFVAAVWFWEHGIHQAIEIAQSVAVGIAFVAFQFWAVLALLIVLRRRTPKHRKPRE